MAIFLTVGALGLGVCVARAEKPFQPRVDEIMRGTHGAAVVSDPGTGQILAVWNRELVFRHAAPPGSTAKLVAAAIALENNVITPDERINCRRIPMLLGEPYHCSHPAALESFTISSALANSCNYFFVALSTRIDAAALMRGYAMFGFGASENIDRPPLRISPDPAAKARAALGEKPVFVTPAELLMAYSAMAIHGAVYELHQGTVNNTKIVRTISLKPSTWQTLADGLEKCVAIGTCQGATVPGIRVAGKTGTSGLPDGSGLTQSWFAGYGPVDAPEVAIVIFLPHGTGARDAAPLAGKILREYFRLRGKP